MISEDFIKEVLQHKWIISLLYGSEMAYEESEQQKEMNGYKNGTNPIHVFMTRNTRWLFLNDNQECYGLLDKYVILMDTEGQIRYFCHGFENIPEVLLKMPMSVENLTNYASWQGIQFKDVLNDYRQILKKHGLKSKAIVKEKEFIKYLKKEVPEGFLK
jgi:hypothetical protein